MIWTLGRREVDDLYFETLELGDERYLLNLNICDDAGSCEDEDSAAILYELGNHSQLANGECHIAIGDEGDIEPTTKGKNHSLKNSQIPKI